MKLRSKLIITFLILILVPVLFTTAAFFGFSHYQINSIKKLYGVENVTYETISNTTAMLSRITREAYDNMREKAEEDPDAFEDPSYLNTVNLDLETRYSFLAVRKDDSYIFVSGFHDGKETVLRLRSDGSVGRITDGVFHKGLGSVAERSFRPHLSCSRLTPDERFLMVCDLGIDQIKVYRFDKKEGRISLADTIRCELESAPKYFMFSSDGRFFYVLYEMKNVIDVYSYQEGERNPIVEKIQTISTTGTEPGQLTAACAMHFSPDEKYLFCSNAGENTVSMYERDEETGMLTMRFCLPISGDYPKDIAIFPDGKHLASINHEGTVSFFKIDYEKGLLVMSRRSMRVNEPNCCEIVKIGE